MIFKKVEHHADLMIVIFLEICFNKNLQNHLLNNFKNDEINKKLKKNFPKFFKYFFFKFLVEKKNFQKIFACVSEENKK